MVENKKMKKNKLFYSIAMVAFTIVLIFAFIGLYSLDNTTQNNRMNVVALATISAVGVSLGSFFITMYFGKRKREL